VSAAQNPGDIAPANVNKLRGAISSAAKRRGATVKRIQALVGNVIVAQMLPDSAIKGCCPTRPSRAAQA